MLIIVIKNIIRNYLWDECEASPACHLLNVVAFSENRIKIKKDIQSNRMEYAGRRGLHIRWQIRIDCRLMRTEKWGQEKQRKRMNQSLQLTHLLHHFPLYAFLYIYFFSVSLSVIVFVNMLLGWIVAYIAGLLIGFIANCKWIKAKMEIGNLKPIFYHLTTFRF